jgi:formylglycine-generating enzyme required for sulfatase activity
MGSRGNDEQRSEQVELRHRRKLDRGFAIAAHEITIEQYKALGFDFKRDRTWAASDDCPINMITWHEAAKFCRRLSRLEGIPESEMCYPEEDEIFEGMKLLPEWLNRTGYRLPTEAEWEYACRAGTTTSRYYGDSSTLLPRYAWTIENAGRPQTLHPVGRLLPNQLGLFDMYGNGFEWTQTVFRDYPKDIDRVYPNELPPSGSDDRAGYVDGDSPMVIRGGAFIYIDSNARSAQRQQAQPQYRHPHNTFRPVRTLPVVETP